MNTPFDIAEQISIDLSRRQRKSAEADARAANAERDANDELYATADLRAREGVSDD